MSFKLEISFFYAEILFCCVFIKHFSSTDAVCVSGTEYNHTCTEERRHICRQGTLFALPVFADVSIRMLTVNLGFDSQYVKIYQYLCKTKVTMSCDTS